MFLEAEASFSLPKNRGDEQGSRDIFAAWAVESRGNQSTESVDFSFPYALLLLYKSAQAAVRGGGEGFKIKHTFPYKLGL